MELNCVGCKFKRIVGDRFGACPKMNRYALECRRKRIDRLNYV